MFDVNRAASVTAPAAVVQDAGLRAHMLGIYNWMCSGLLVTAIIAYTVANTAIGSIFYHMTRSGSHLSVHPTVLGYLAIFSPLAFTLIISFGFSSMSRTALAALFWAFSAAMGVSMASVFIVYVGSSIAATFFITAAMFAGTSIYGYTTGTDLSRMGSFMVMALIGIILAMIVNIFIGSTLVNTLISVAGVLIFTGLTAWDTQRIRNDWLESGGNTELMSKKSIMDALSLYLNFINLFQFMLQFTGTRRSN